MLFASLARALIHTDTRAEKDMLQELELFISIPGALLTTLRIFTSIPFMLDLEVLYKNSSGIRVYCMSYALVTVVVLCALVTSVANKLFQSQVSSTVLLQLAVQQTHSV
jgi:hypothetical protein